MNCLLSASQGYLHLYQLLGPSVSTGIQCRCYYGQFYLYPFIYPDLRGAIKRNGLRVNDEFVMSNPHENG